VKTQCGYLIVPENRKKYNSKKIKLPFIIVKSKNQDKKKDPVLYTAGGPGGSSLGWANGISRSTVILDRDCIAFEQRGTRFSLPHLRNFELDNAVRESYRKNLSKDSMYIVGTSRYKKKLEERGIDLSGYNTDETVADIHDLLDLLNIDSINLFGGSYSGGLMLAVLQKKPSRIRSLVLDSPLPTFIPIDEQEPVNFINALNILFDQCEKDSTDSRYKGLKEKFTKYFTSIIGKSFYISYLEKETTDTLKIQYTKNELLDAIVNGMLNSSALKDVPLVVTEIISGNHDPYIKRKLDDIFNKNIAPDGMRMSVYCADQFAYNNKEKFREVYAIYPHMKGYHINDVYDKMCECWQVPPVDKKTKQAFYSTKPILMGDGEMDPACSPLYMYMIKHYMPNGQIFLFKNRSHGIGGSDFHKMIQQFIDNPFKKIESPNKDIIRY
jgi:pimeloyl-ACP methyl ester carboxylesterase